jgi:hypothetical protein
MSYVCESLSLIFAFVFHRKVFENEKFKEHWLFCCLAKNFSCLLYGEQEKRRETLLVQKATSTAQRKIQ